MTATHTGPGLSTATLDDALLVLRRRGLRASSARRLVLENLFAAEEPVSAERISDGLGGRFPRSDLASVYRNLETLERVGLVRHFHLVHGPGLYAPASRERDYLVCERCGALRPVLRGALDDVKEAIRTRFGLLPRFNHYPLVGLCEECACSAFPA
jgi:Fur family transcriptional regulator, ferric uptake regulator